MNNTKTIIIAEAGVNHNGSIEIAKQLIDVAIEAGVDYVKFQTFKASGLVTRQANQAEYQAKNTGMEISQFEMLKKLELSYDQHIELIDYCKKQGIKFLSTAFDMESIDFLSSLRLGVWKIPSGEITNYLYLKRIAQEKQPVIISTGMSTLDEVKAAVEVLIQYGVEKNDVTVLHCNSQYPTPMDNVNLLAMRTIQKEIGVKVGYSDHTPGIEIPIAAVALGATVIEKHFTLSKSMEGPDHKASLEPNELKSMVVSIRNIEKALGSSVKNVSPSERENLEIARKSIVASKFIAKGELLTEENLAIKRPGNGISPMRWETVLHKTAVRDFTKDELIEL